MWLILGGGREVHRVPQGKRLQMRCPKCSQQATFYECRVKKSVSLFFVALWDKTETVMQCGECLAAFRQEGAANEAPSEAERLQRQAKAEKEAIERLAAEGQKVVQERQRREGDIEKELAALKKKMGQ